jgi:hypothetical protein
VDYIGSKFGDGIVYFPLQLGNFINSPLSKWPELDFVYLYSVINVPPGRLIADAARKHENLVPALAQANEEIVREDLQSTDGVRQIGVTLRKYPHVMRLPVYPRHTMPFRPVRKTGD